MTHESGIAVFPALVAFEGLRLQDGRTIMITVDEPRAVHVVAYREGEEVIIASQHSTRGAAETAAKALAKRIQQAGEALTDAADKLTQIAKAARRKPD